MKNAVWLLILAFSSSPLLAGDAEDLIALDKAWGSAESAADVENMFSADLISLDGSGPGGKAEQLASMAEAPDEPYVAGDYKVNLIDADTAVMIHSAGTGDEAHWSMHVWKRTEAGWKVVATAAVAADD